MKKRCTTMFNRNLLTHVFFYGVRQSLCSSRRIRLPFDFAQGWLERIHSELLTSVLNRKTLI